MVSIISCCPRGYTIRGTHTHTHKHTICLSRSTDRLARCPAKTLKSPFMEPFGIWHEDQQSCFSPWSAQRTHIRTHKQTPSAIRESAGCQSWIGCFSQGKVISKCLRAIKKVLLVCLISRRIIVFLWMSLPSDSRQWRIGITCTVLMDEFQPYTHIPGPQASVFRA